MATIDRGEEYIYDDFVDNIIAILNANKSTLGVRYVGTHLDFHIAKFPSLYVVFDNAEEEWVTMPRQKDIKMTCMIHYYHRNLNTRVRKDEIDEALGKICKLIREHHDCNGFLNTDDGFTIERVDALGELRGGEGAVADGLIEVSGVKRMRITITNNVY